MPDMKDEDIRIGVFICHCGGNISDHVDVEKLDLTILLVRIMFPYILFMGLVALSMGILNVHGRFFVPAFSPFFWTQP